jgi:deoxycytidine triphosphate deaminase
MLSNEDIIRELGKNLEICPISEENIKGSSINLTSSNMAWSVSTKKTAVDKEKGVIILKSNDTTLILTKEIFAVSNKIAGSFHSRVVDVSIGEGHISTVINPGWCGRPLIAVNNGTKNDIELKIGDPFVIMVLDYLHTPSSIMVDKNKTSRLDILHEYSLSRTEHDQIYNKDIQNMSDLRKKTKNERYYENIKKAKHKKEIYGLYFQLFILLASISLIVFLTIKDMTDWNALPIIVVTGLATNYFAKWQKK